MKGVPAYVVAALDPAVRADLVSVELGVDECDGQWGVYLWRP